MTKSERASCIITIDLLWKLAHDVHGLRDVVSARNCEKIIALLNEPERKTGRWIKAEGSYVTPGGDEVWQCSECGKGIHVYGIEHGTYGADLSDGQWVSCPNCGCLMNEELTNV